MKLNIPLLILGFLMNNSVSAQFTSGMTYTDSNGNSINPYSILEDNKYIYLDFFSTSCGACNSVADEVANACESYGSNNSNVVFIGVDYNSTASSCQDFAISHNSSFPIIAGQETGASIFSLFGVTGYPTGKLINPSGEIEASFTYSQIVNLTDNLSSYLSPINECDLVSILSLELNTQNQSLELTVITDAPYMYPYPSFMLMNENGDTLAQEQVNYYGLSDYETTHALELLSDYNSWDDNLILNLYSGFYDLLECSFEVNLGDLEIMGCTDVNAENYNSEAIIDDGYCLYTSNCENIYIDLYEGWNLVGFSCTNELDAVAAFSPYIENLIIVKDYLGNAYLPDWDFNGIGNLERGYGYQIKIAETIQDFNLCNE